MLLIATCSTPVVLITVQFMPSTFQDAFGQGQSLAKDFEAIAKDFLSPFFKESEALKSFIDKILIPLRWNAGRIDSDSTSDGTFKALEKYT